ncbi:AAA family ATPase, partial [Amphritea sp.]|uniref:AAA family ATPase n=1 Tax=Amphritea sp. TaxID=1872502 RepID=UPI003D123264
FLLLVTGPAGSGKTMLIHQLQNAESDRTLRLCSVDGSKTSSLNGLLVALSKQLSPELDIQADNQQMLNAIYSFAQVMAVEHIQWVIIIDNADQLEQPAIQLLLQMLSEAQGLPVKPHLLMTAREGFEARLQAFDEYTLLESQVHQLVLEPFTFKEAKSYLYQRYSAAASLSEKQLQAVFDVSKGYPGALNQQAEQLFRSGTVNKTNEATGVSRLHLVSIAAVLLVILVAGLWQYWPESDVGTTRTQVQIQVPVEAEPVIASSDSPPVVATLEVERLVPSNDNEIEEKPVQSDDLPIATAEIKGSSEVPSSVVVVSPDAEPEKSDTAAVKTNQGMAKSSSETPASPAETITKPVVNEVVQTAPVEALAPAKVSKVATDKAADIPKPVVASKSVSSGSQLSEAEQALMGWPSTGYTLQMLGAGKQSSAEQFIQDQAEPQKFYMFQTRYKNKPWFVVVYGQYKDRNTAHAAAAALPSALAKLKPWARTIQGIQADIATRK